jgi:hypothetical protein
MPGEHAVEVRKDAHAERHHQPSTLLALDPGREKPVHESAQCFVGPLPGEGLPDVWSDEGM